MTRTRAIRMCLITCLIFVAGTAYAVGPELPLRFDADPVGKDVQVLALIVDSGLVTNLRLERRLYRNGELLDRTRLDSKLEPSPQHERADRKILEVRLPLRFEGMGKLKPGLYAQKFVAEGEWSEVPDSRPVHVERWSRFQVDRRGGVRLLSLEEYSALADPSEVSIDSAGRRVLVQVGIARKGEVALPKTRGSPAIPLGNFGGLLEERPDDGKPEYKKRKEDKSEIDEN